MNPVRMRRWAYFAFVIFMIPMAVVIFMLLRGQPLVLLSVAAILLISGQVARWLLRSLIASRRQLARREYQNALFSAQQFLEDCHKRPWIRHAIWFQFGIYSWDVVAMGPNNAGAALLELGRFEESQKFLDAAHAQDVRSPLPIMNLARLALRRGDRAKARQLGAEAHRMGFPFADIEEFERILAAKARR
jgi:tetratricopeptide (TPR) repeat protein